ncbi:predicted protein [Chaetomium globosum CBS 148.51]|uniref:Uncharacterized protein n=1 Tax=Chaetomium globosum (strain ATCC 6205 / CBS 148.51 / DSM 1962 / NBRC 6347 / NRRL 1970) TaxID=306901 RepID=Q2H7A5_CHAGB|nr:uncharacterized protein CHGG_05460 [Chaetomium globosum CBS 148.51]EAQ88841.1 predicted protein [Chaetomium globosum CBS 148.51]
MDSHGGLDPPEMEFDSWGDSRTSNDRPPGVVECTRNMMELRFPEEIGGEVEERWLGLEEGWVYRSSWGEEKMMKFVEGLDEMEVVVKEVTEAEARGADPKFVLSICGPSAINSVRKTMPKLDENLRTSAAALPLPRGSISSKGLTHLPRSK